MTANDSKWLALVVMTFFAAMGVGLSIESYQKEKTKQLQIQKGCNCKDCKCGEIK